VAQALTTCSGFNVDEAETSALDDASGDCAISGKGIEKLSFRTSVGQIAHVDPLSHPKVLTRKPETPNSHPALTQ
jgi:hypothetical protein